MILLIAFVVVTVLWFGLMRPRRGGPNAPPLVLSSPVVPIPFIGVLIEFFMGPHYMVKRCYADYGPVFTIPLFFKRLTFLIGPDAQEVFFKASDDVLSQREVYDFMRPVFGPHIVYDAPKKNRQVQFQSVSNGLKAQRLKAYVSKIEQETRQYLEKEWGNGPGETDLFTALSELTILTASRCLHGEDVRQYLFKEVCHLYHDLDHGLTPLTVFWPEAPTQAHRRRNQARQEMIALFSKVIKERRTAQEGTTVSSSPGRKPTVGSDGTDILSIFMDITYKDGTPITEEEITGLLIALLFAGQHTSCITSTWTTMFIVNDPDILQRVLAEQDEVLQEKLLVEDKENDATTATTTTTPSLTYEDVQQMDLLNNCMREALRMCPTFIMILRKAERDIGMRKMMKQRDDVNLEQYDYTIPKGDYVCVSPTVSMRLKSCFENPDTFDPDRFAEPRSEHKAKPYTYLGFGGGVHSCMGQNFALVQVKTILSVLLREYELERVSDKMPDIGYNDMVVGPVGDCRVRYKKKQQN